MKYYKWMYEDAKTVHRVPSFVWINLQDALDMKEEVKGWACSLDDCDDDERFNLYEMDGPEPVETHLLFRTHMIPTRRYPPLSSEEFQEVHEYFEGVKWDYFGMKDSDKDLELFFRYATTAKVLKSTADPWGYGIKEAYIPLPMAMHQMNLNEDVISIVRLITEDPDLFNEDWEELGIDDPQIFETNLWPYPFDLDTIVGDENVVARLDDIKYYLVNLGVEITGLEYESIGDPDFEWAITFKEKGIDGRVWAGFDWLFGDERGDGLNNLKALI